MPTASEPAVSVLDCRIGIELRGCFAVMVSVLVLNPFFCDFLRLFTVPNRRFLRYFAVPAWLHGFPAIFLWFRFGTGSFDMVSVQKNFNLNRSTVQKLTVLIRVILTVSFGTVTGGYSSSFNRRFKKPWASLVNMMILWSVYNYTDSFLVFIFTYTNFGDVILLYQHIYAKQYVNFTKLRH